MSAGAKLDFFAVCFPKSVINVCLAELRLGNVCYSRIGDDARRLESQECAAGLGLRQSLAIYSVLHTRS